MSSGARRRSLGRSRRGPTVVVAAALTLTLALLAPGCATSMPLPSAAGVASGIVFDRAIAAWTDVLDRYVDAEGRIDFARISKDPDDLDLFVVYIAKPKSAGFRTEFPTAKDRLAYFINAYNALAIHNLILSGTPRELGAFTRLRALALHDFMMGGRYTSLWEFRNRQIRRMGDERVAFALVDGVRGGPALPRRPFTGPRLDAELDAAAKRFLNDPRHVRVDAARGVVALSELLLDYRRDFLAKAPSLIAYVNRYRDEKVPESSAIEPIPMDWTLDSALDSAEPAGFNR